MNGGGLSRWPPFNDTPVQEQTSASIKNSVDTGEVLDIPAGHQYIVYRDFTANGVVIGNGELVIL